MAINKSTAQAVINLAIHLGTNVPSIIAQLRPLFKDGEEAELQAQLDASDTAADDADRRAEEALRP